MKGRNKIQASTVGNALQKWGGLLRTHTHNNHDGADLTLFQIAFRLSSAYKYCDVLYITAMHKYR